MKSTSVVICTQNQAPRLRLTLRALSVQTMPPREIIVVDDASSDDTRRVVDEARTFLGTCDVKYIRNPEPQGSPGARNRGAREAAGDLLVFLDSDALVTRDHLKHHAEAQSARGPAVTCGPLWHTTTTEFLRNPCTGELFEAPIPPEVQKRLDQDLAGMLIREEDVLNRFDSIVRRSAPGAYPALGFLEAEGERLGDAAGHPAAWVLMTPHNAAVPRDVFERFGGFDAQMPFCEGWEFVLRLKAGGIPTLRVPGAPTYHLFHYRRFEDFDQHVRRWRSITMIADKHHRRSLLLVQLFFDFNSPASGFPEEAAIHTLDKLAELIERYDHDLGAYEVLLRGHPQYSELEDALAARHPVKSL